MNIKRGKKSFEDLFADLNHPNPNINQLAIKDMKELWPSQSIDRLIGNLDSENIEPVRKGVRAICYFVTEIVI